MAEVPYYSRRVEAMQLATLTAEHVWLGIGFAGQSLFFLRFLVQWIYSERLGRSAIPTGFWYLSIAGGLIVLSYAIYRLDPVFIAGQSVGILVYGRNLYLIHRERTRGVNC
jgi:lipid-A-disaccharide synthase-like uncharacterized protein